MVVCVAPLCSVPLPKREVQIGDGDGRIIRWGSPTDHPGDTPMGSANPSNPICPRLRNQQHSDFCDPTGVAAVSEYTCRRELS